MSSQEWAAYTGRLEAVQLIQRLLERPCPEQFGDKYKPELPLALNGAAKPPSSKTCLQRLSRCLRAALSPRARALQDGGVLDHMVRMTTSHYSPAVAIGCQTVCPDSPPCVGKRRLAVQEILEARARRSAGAPEQDQGVSGQPQLPASHTLGDSREGTPEAGLGSPQPRSSSAPRKASLRTLQRLRRGSVRPGVVIPRVRVSKAPAPTYQPERQPSKDSAHLQLPKWRYKEAKEEKRKAEEAERQRLAEAQKEKRAPRWRKRT